MTDLTEIAREITIDDCYQEEVFDMREDIFGDKTIPIQVVESLVKVIDYTYHDEEEHYKENATTMEDKLEHIFPHISLVDDWVQMLLDSNTHQPVNKCE